MKIVNVVPIIKGSPSGSLSYFTSKPINIGALVTVPLRRKTAPAIVCSIENAKEAKSFLRKSGFPLKPVAKVKNGFFLSPEFIAACEEIANYFISPVGAVIKDFTPKAILESGEPGAPLISSSKNEGGRHEIFLIQAPKDERFQYYKSVIREKFAQNNSVFVCLPTISEVEDSAEELARGIEKYTIVMHNKMPAKKIREGWKRAAGENHPVLVIATKSFFSLPRQDINTIIVDGESSMHYKLQRRPYIDVRKAAEIISRKRKTRLIFGDLVTRVETFRRQETGEFSPPPSVPSRILSGAEQIIADMNFKNTDEWRKTKIFPVIGPRLSETIRAGHLRNERVILLVNRRGYNPTTVCNSCMRTIMCQKCDTPLVLHKAMAGKKNVFVCHKCMEQTETNDKCPYCKSWEIESYGTGIQKVAEDLSKMFPATKIFRMDGDSVKNEKYGKIMARDFLNSPGAILVGTEMLFSYIKQPVERAAVVSLDAMFTLPDFRIGEKIFYLLLRLRALAKITFLVQTRMAEDKLFNEAVKGSASGFYRAELENRKKFNYPPFKLFIRISALGKSAGELKKKTHVLEKLLEEWGPVSYPSFVPKIKGVYEWHILLKIEPNSWPNEQKKLHDILSHLPPSWKVDVEPESLL